MNLDGNCSRHFTYRSLIECGDTFHAGSFDNQPVQQQTWEALSQLASHLLDPVVEEFGSLTLTYGFCSQELAKARKRYATTHNSLPAIFSAVDQHASYELNTKGERICERGGAACDFIVPGVSSLQIALWIVRELPFDRIYFYGSDKPIHVSHNREGSIRKINVMAPKASGRGYIPSTLSVEQFLERFGDEL